MGGQLQYGRCVSLATLHFELFFTVLYSCIVVLWRINLSLSLSAITQLLMTSNVMCNAAQCSIEVLAYGASSDGTTRYGFVKLNTRPVWQSSWFGAYRNLRGVTIVVVDPFSCTVKVLRTFDTFARQSISTEMSNYLQALNRGAIIVGVTADEPTNNLSPALQTLREMGADVADVQYRAAFGFVAQKGFAGKTVLRKAITQAEAQENQPHFSVTITGAIYCCNRHTHSPATLSRDYH